MTADRSLVIPLNLIAAAVAWATCAGLLALGIVANNLELIALGMVTAAVAAVASVSVLLANCRRIMLEAIDFRMRLLVEQLRGDDDRNRPTPVTTMRR